MALDTLFLGPFEFSDFATPPVMPYQGKQAVVVNKMPGGDRAVDCYGPDDPDPRWNGILWGEGAAAQARQLKAMCEAGQELPLSWGMESRTVVITEFDAQVEKYNCIHYHITVTFTDNPYGQGSGGGGGGISFDGMVGADLGAAKDAAASSLGTTPAEALANGTAPL